MVTVLLFRCGNLKTIILQKRKRKNSKILDNIEVCYTVTNDIFTPTRIHPFIDKKQLTNKIK